MLFTYIAFVINTLAAYWLSIAVSQDPDDGFMQFLMLGNIAFALYGFIRIIDYIVTRMH